MFAKYVNSKGEVIKVDNGDGAIGKVKIEGDNPNDVKAIDILINKRTIIRGVTLDYIKKHPGKFIKVDGVYRHNTASNYFFQKKIPTIMKNYGYEVTSN